MNSGTGLIAPLVQSFFSDHLVRQRRASPQTWQATETHFDC